MTMLERDRHALRCMLPELFPSDDDCDSLCSDYFAWCCAICGATAIGSASMELNYLHDEIVVADANGKLWVKCQGCRSAFHLFCIGCENPHEITGQYNCWYNCK